MDSPLELERALLRSGSSRTTRSVLNKKGSDIMARRAALSETLAVAARPLLQSRARPLTCQRKGLM